MDGARANRVAQPDRIVWQGARIGRIAVGMAFGIALLALAGALFTIRLTASQGPHRTRETVIPLAIAAVGLIATLIPARLTYAQAKRRFEIRPDALVLHDANGTTSVPWGTIAEVTLTLRTTQRTDAGTVGLHLRLHDGTLLARTMYYVEEGMFRALAHDLRPGPAAHGVPYTVHGPQVITDEIAALAASARPPVPPRPPARPAPPPLGPLPTPPYPPAPPP
ncbi:hypothetical protein [Embleya sp. NBC_00896]|uniref:hypothetical protein n=1 Tax=Embleya sp. NBC_00896 TaxID=2975961 RepID=UPI002F919A73|nr:hypothetical protein OG928_33595 [Embleya sp. NBC_00896]